MTPRESLERSFRLTELRRKEMADEIASSHPDWSPREVELERNRRWLLEGLEGEVYGPTSEMFYELLRISQRRDGADTCRAIQLLKERPEPFNGRFANAIEQLGLRSEWEAVCAGADHQL